MSSQHSDEKLDELIELVELIIKNKGQDAEDHANEHRWIRAQMQEAEARRDFWVAVGTRVASGVVWSAVATVFGAILFTIKGNIS